MEESLSKLEEKILRFWKDHQIFEKSLAIRKRAKPFRFYEGPPTANAAPGFHHVLARVYKDIICRYKTMRGFYVGRKAGWDTHGLPVELQIEKELGIKHKSEIEKFGIAEFNRKAQESVWRYKDEWEKFTERIGFWLDLKHPYITYETPYIETLWWILKEIWKKGLLVQDYKVVPWCPRCETPLSSHEVAQGYKLTKDPSAFVKLKIKNEKLKNLEYLLVWTTTPWTLPGNVAVAVNPGVIYTKFKIGDAYYWSATPPPVEAGAPIEVIEKCSGKSLLGLEYEPIFKSKVKGQMSNVFHVVAGDFVSTEEGTGFVHIAPAFGEEDLEVSKKEGLPVILNVSGEGRFAFRKQDLSVEPFFRKIHGKFVKDADPIIFRELERRKTLFRGDLTGTEHDYPFCWRCNTPLLYYATKSWFIKMSQLRSRIIANNKKINWIPGHLKEGRFGEWLRELKDWALSRERYWGTPLPAWRCEKKGCIALIGSLAELNRRAHKPNTFYVMRHGEADHNLSGIIAAWPEPKGREARLTARGKRDVERAAKALSRERIDFIVSSDHIRMKETVTILRKYLRRAKVLYDARLRELNCGIFNYHQVREHKRFSKSKMEEFTKRPTGGENLSDASLRLSSIWQELNQKYRGKNILILSHGDPLWVFEGKVRGLAPQEIVKSLPYPGLARWLKLPPNDLPHNDEGLVDLHRPYVDDVILECQNCGSTMRRVKDVIDVWFDSGAMPFAQSHFPFDCAPASARPRRTSAGKQTQNYKKLVKTCLEFPADYIAEAIDQTRGWFYTLLAISTTLDLGPSYLNVISTGHVLDAKGEKMSKSKGNVVDPWEMIKKYGADSLRWYFFTVNAPGEPKRFAERDLSKSHQNLLVLWNVLKFWELYSPRKLKIKNEKLKINVLDNWILAKLSLLIKEAANHLDRYEIVEAARKIENFFLEDLSRWYVRRSRRRMQKPTNKKELEAAAGTLAVVLGELAKLMAPFTPFLAEHIWRSVSGRLKGKRIREESVHLAAFPKPIKVPKAEMLLTQVEAGREVASLILRLRASAGIKVRQPLQSAEILEKRDSIRLPRELLQIIADEVNVKEVRMVAKLSEGPHAKILTEEKWYVALNTEITAELREEAMLRELIRAIQDARHDLGLNPEDRISLFLQAPDLLQKSIHRATAMILRAVGAKELHFARTEKLDIEKEFLLEEYPVWLGIRKLQ